MTRTEACSILVRRLGLNPGRVTALAQRCAEAGQLPMARGRDVPDLGALELARLFLAVVCDRGLGSAAKSVTEFSALATESGVNLLDVMEGLFAGRISATSIRQMIIQLSPAGAVLISEHHLKFGAAPSTDGAAKTVVVPGDVLAAIALEFQNLTAEQADTSIVLGRLSQALN